MRSEEDERKEKMRKKKKEKRKKSKVDGAVIARERVDTRARARERARRGARTCVRACPCGVLALRSFTVLTHARTHARTYARTHARMHAATERAHATRVHVWKPGHAVFYVYDTYWSLPRCSFD